MWPRPGRATVVSHRLSTYFPQFSYFHRSVLSMDRPSCFFVNWESLVPEVPRIFGGVGVVVGGFLGDVGAFWGDPDRPL